ncbi:hypothetical protein FISHEDRAFT_63095 [Fistulina hepatica ATCC 64428]|uniref:CCHC-type domain-containing protein n=1 Tax=Fistulina hepatica ATCC 64428 TaxID=1128425 RepID=A0A0D6ZYN9_9AGAR|nr:hypothetical protein FISHEDRAFT_63095 [Fistulina hepatica ATCC 64428]
MNGLHPEVIDLTEEPDSPPTIICIDDDDDSDARKYSGDSLESAAAAATSGTDTSSKPKRRGRKKRRKRPLDLQTNTPDDLTDREAGEIVEDSTPALAPKAKPHQSARDETLSLFFIDDAPSSADSTVENLPVIAPESPSSVPYNSNVVVDGLLLPAHVYLLDAADPSIETVRPPTPDPVNDDQIEYLDYDDSYPANRLRYFNSMEQKVKIVCKTCGAEGEHSTRNCPVKICLTCGKRDDHETWRCDLNKTCYTCGTKGHINSNCPNRYDLTGYCGRCGSSLHMEKQCPNLWRVYTYRSVEEREAALLRRDQAQFLDLGEGGEGYIGEEAWCYNCATMGHWGDDCERKRLYNTPNAPSLFGSVNVLSGPYHDAGHGESNRTRHRHQSDGSRRHKSKDHNDSSRSHKDRKRDRERDKGRHHRRQSPSRQSRYINEYEEKEERREKDSRKRRRSDNGRKPKQPPDFDSLQYEDGDQVGADGADRRRSKRDRYDRTNGDKGEGKSLKDRLSNDARSVEFDGRERNRPRYNGGYS